VSQVTLLLYRGVAYIRGALKPVHDTDTDSAILPLHNETCGVSSDDDNCLAEYNIAPRLSVDALILAVAVACWRHCHKHTRLLSAEQWQSMGRVVA